MTEVFMCLTLSVAPSVRLSTLKFCLGLNLFMTDLGNALTEPTPKFECCFQKARHRQRGLLYQSVMLREV